MPTITQISAYAQTSLASYASGLIFNGVGNQGSYKLAGMADAQALAFDQDWAVLQQSTPTASGFSAVLLQNRTTNEKVLAIAGTDPSSPADLATDFQVLTSGTVANMSQYMSLESFYTQLITANKLSAAEQFTVTGHSLGGFLAQAFTARHTSVVSAAYTYNAPGFGTTELLLGFLGVTDTTGAAAKITNVHATDGLSMTAGLGITLGTSQPVRIEVDPNPLANHSLKTLTDTLSIYKAYGDLQPSLTMAQAANLFISSCLGNRKLEGALDALRTVFVDAASNDANKTPTGDREAFFNNLAAMTGATGPGSFQTLKGQVQLIATNNGFVTLAQANTSTALAYRYALLELQPFAVVANADAQNQTLYGNYAQPLSLYDSATGTGNLTPQWMTDRAALLQALGMRNQQDNSTNSVLDPAAMANRVTFFHFTDPSNPATETVLSTQRTAVAGLQEQHILFGNDQADTLTGYNNVLSDHLYGGAGADTLNGLGGTDYLEGGTGADIYNFTDSFGHDTILDTDGSGEIKIGSAPALTGGKKIGDGLWESDDKKTLYIQHGADLLIGQRAVAGASTVYGTITVKNWQNTQLGLNLEGTAAPVPAGTLIFNGDQRAPLNGSDYNWGATSWANDGSLTGGISEPNFNDVIDATAAGTNGSVMHGFGGNDALSGSSGKDDIFGDDGDDLIGGGAGSDNIRGGLGNDFIASASTLTVAQRLSPTDSWTLPGSATLINQGSNWGAYSLNGVIYWPTPNGAVPDDAPDVVDAGDGNDYVIAGRGSDYIDGGIGDDDLTGGGGSDIIDGGDGIDYIQGDGRVATGFYDSVDAALHGDDFMDGGAGADQIRGQGGNDELYGGLGNDALLGDDVNETYLSGALHGNKRIFATSLIARCDYSTRATGRFDCETPYKTLKRHSQRRWQCANATNVHVRSVKLSGHKCLERRMDRAWVSSYGAPRSISSVEGNEALQ